MSVGRDLIVLAADRDIENAVLGILSRHISYRARRIDAEIYTHVGHDPGCYNEAGKFLAIFRDTYAHALVVFDRDGCGHETNSREVVEAKVQNDLASVWENDAAAIVIDPELEAWVWSDSPHVDSILGWEGRAPQLRDWLKEKGLLGDGEVKPSNPKAAMEQALREARIQRSSARFRRLAESVSLDRCTDTAFGKLKATLAAWFPA